MLIKSSLIMQIAQSMQISIRHFLTPHATYITFPLKNLAVKNIFGLVCLASGLLSYRHETKSSGGRRAMRTERFQIGNPC